MKVNEIFYSIEGEGIRAGMPCVFIRLFGCNLNCSYCDTRYSCVGNDYKEMTVEDICIAVARYQCPNITVTGGEPLIHEDIYKLLRTLSDNDYYVNVETNGTKEPFDDLNNVFYTIDFKTNISGMSDKMNIRAFKALGCTDVIKFVVGSIEDIEQSIKFYYENGVKAVPYISPVFGKIEPKMIAEYMKRRGLNDWRLQLQLHKYIWEPQKRGV